MPGQHLCFEGLGVLALVLFQWLTPYHQRWHRKRLNQVKASVHLETSQQLVHRHRPLDHVVHARQTDLPEEVNHMNTREELVSVLGLTENEERPLTFPTNFIGTRGEDRRLYE